MADKNKDKGVTESTGTAATGSKTAPAGDLERVMSEAGEKLRKEGETDFKKIREAKLAARNEYLGKTV